MASDSIKLLVRKINELPSLPMVAQKILHIAGQRSSTVKDLADIVMMDPSLTAKVLRVVNSSFYGLKSQVTTVTHAISLLGFNVIKNMVLGLSIFEALKMRAKDSTLDHMALWEHSLACGMFSRSMIRRYFSLNHEQPDKPRFFREGIHRMNFDISEEAFIGGLLHDIGKIILDQFFSEKLREIVQRASKNEEDIWDVEREITGVPHTEVGAWLARYWKLPRIHRWCIRYHHLIPYFDSMRPKDHHVMAFIVEASDFFVRLFDIGFSANPWLQILPKELWEFIGIKESDYEQILFSLKEEIDDTKKAFGLGDGSGSLSNQERERLETLRERKLLFCYMAPRFIDPIHMVLNSLELRWEGVAIGKDLIDRTRSFEPDILVIDLLDHIVDDESLIPLLRKLRMEMTGSMIMLGLNDWKRVQRHLLGEGPVLGFSMLPSRGRWIQEFARIVSSNGLINGQRESREPGSGNVVLSGVDNLDGRNRIDYDTTDVDAVQDLDTVKQMRRWIQGSWSTERLDKTKYLYLKGTDAEQQLDVGQCIGGKYEIIGHLRRGGMADVYKVKVVGSDTLCALKLLPFHFLRDRKMVQRFRQEASEARRLNHPNITRILDYSEDSSNHYLIMELATGWKTSEGQIALDVGNLHKPMDVSTAVGIFKQACKGLGYIHNKGIIHRDIKPENLLLFDDEQVKLTDFGIARSLETISLTMTGMLIGTPEYMSPEQGEGDRALTPGSDIYSLGVVMYELLIGHSPFKRKTSLATMIAHIHDPSPILQELNAAVPDALQNIVLKCLNKSKDQRFKSAVELYQEIDKYFGEQY